MITLLKTEWLKIKNYTVFKILMIAFGAGIILTNYIVYIFNKNVISQNKAGMLLSSFNPYSFDNTWQTTSYATGWLLILPAMLIIILVTNEYAYRTHRQNIIDGWSRKDFISVKLWLAFLIAMATTLMVLLTALVSGLLTGSDFSLHGFSHIGIFFVKAVTYNMFAVLISVLVKRTGFAIGIYFIYLGTENFLAQLLDVWSMRIKINGGRDLGSMGDYLPMNAADGLLTFPDNSLKTLAKSSLPTDYTWLVGALALIYLLLFIFWSRKKFIRSDL